MAGMTGLLIVKWLGSLSRQALDLSLKSVPSVDLVVHGADRVQHRSELVAVAAELAGVHDHV